MRDELDAEFVAQTETSLDAKCVSRHCDADPQGGIYLSGAPQDPDFETGLTVMEEGKYSFRKAPADIFTKSYYALCQGQIFWGDDGNDPEKAARALVPRFGGRNTIQVAAPGGRYGAIGSRLMKILRAGREGVDQYNDFAIPSCIRSAITIRTVALGRKRSKRTT